jgi:hypothetical protein
MRGCLGKPGSLLTELIHTASMQYQGTIYSPNCTFTYCIREHFKMLWWPLWLLISMLLFNCKKDGSADVVPSNVLFNYNLLKVNGVSSGLSYKGINTLPVIKISFTAPVQHTSVAGAVSLIDKKSSPSPLDISYENADSTLIITPTAPLDFLSGYTLAVSYALTSNTGNSLVSPLAVEFLTAIDSTDKFPAISIDSLLTLVQKQTFKYFWEFGHSVSGLARERNTSGDVVTTGGSGFGMMALPVAIQRKFITKEEGLARMQKTIDFLKNKAQRYHGAYPHWLNGATGITIPFSVNDDGADLVETSYLMMGLLTVRQYFNGPASDETALRKDITALWDAVEWDFFTRDGSNKLFWHWSPTKSWIMNMPIQGWSECLITYVLAASSNTHSITKAVYDNGFARNGAEKNDNSYYGYQLPLGEAYGGPLFFEQYSFLGLNPKGLSDAYASYQIQVVNHSKINYEYCKANPKDYFGYSKSCWGLTASDIQNGYTASSPTNDVGVIAPTAAISSMPFIPEESLRALNFFYYKMGDKIWGQYGMVDAFSLNDIWFAGSYLAIDQGPQIGMIENYRTGLLWKLFMSCPEVQAGLTKLGFTYQIQ